MTALIVFGLLFLAVFVAGPWVTAARARLYKKMGWPEP